MNTIAAFFVRSNNLSDAGLLVIRLGIGASMMMLHGLGKITGGSEAWVRYGGSMQMFGIHFFPAFWGFMAAFSEFFCSLFIILGVFFRPATTLLIITLLVAAIRHLSLPPDAPNSGLSGASHALEFVVIYVGLFLAGPGKYSLLKTERED